MTIRAARRRWVSRGRSVLAAAMLTVLALLIVSSTAVASNPSTTVGVYVGANDAQGVTQFESWLGHPVAHVLDFFATQEWSDISSPNWWLDGWSSSPYSDRMVYGVPLIPDSGGTLEQGAAGDYNNYFITLAQNLVAAGEGNAILRLGWEFNGNSYSWSAASDPTAFIQYWRQVVTAMRSVPGAAFKFDWSVSEGAAAMSAAKAYPGNAYVDYIGLDVYDWDWTTTDPVQRWDDLLSAPDGLTWQRNFAAAHGKQMSFPEWGLAPVADHGGGDDPYFIQKMYDWIATHNVAYSIYYDDGGTLTNGTYPHSAATFLALFGTSTPKQLIRRGRRTRPSPLI